MKNKIILFFWVFTFLLGPCSSNAQEKDTIQDTSVFAKADSLYMISDFAKAALEYERIIFLSPQSQIKNINTALFARVKCFKMMKRFDKASDELLRIKLYYLDSNQLADFYYEKILCYYLQGLFNDALGSIEEMYLNIQDSSMCNSSLILQILTYNELKQWKKAKEIALIYARTYPVMQQDSIIKSINKLYAKDNIPKLKSQKTSKILAFIPGLAHIYAGYWIEGIVSFTLNASVLAFGVYEVYTGYYLTGYLLGAGILSATYFGNIDRASFLLQKHNYEKVNSFNRQVRDELLKL